MIAILDNLDGAKVMILSTPELINEIKISHDQNGEVVVSINQRDGPPMVIRRKEILTISARRGLMSTKRKKRAKT